MSSPFPFSLAVAGAFLVCPLIARGAPEDTPEDKVAPPRTMRVLAIGDDPPYREEYRDGVRVQLPPPPGSVPPREMTLTSVAAEGDPDESPPEPKALGDIQLRLGYLSSEIQIGPGSRRIAFQAPDESTWATVASPERGNFFVILWRRSGADSWDAPRHLVLPAPAEPGRVTFLNLSPAAAAIGLGEEKFGLAPGKFTVRDLPPGDPLALGIAARDAQGRTLRIHQSAVEQGRDEMTWVIVWRADGREPRQPVKVKKLRVRIR